MKYIKRPRFEVLRGEEALEALYNYVNELEEKENSELTEKHKAALKKVARALISSLEDKVQNKENFMKHGSMIPLGNIKRAILTPLRKSKSKNNREDYDDGKAILHDSNHYSQLLMTQQIQ